MDIGKVNSTGVPQQKKINSGAIPAEPKEIFVSTNQENPGLMPKNIKETLLSPNGTTSPDKTDNNSSAKIEDKIKQQLREELKQTLTSEYEEFWSPNSVPKTEDVRGAYFQYRLGSEGMRDYLRNDLYSDPKNLYIDAVIATDEKVICAVSWAGNLIVNGEGLPPNQKEPKRTQIHIFDKITGEKIMTTDLRSPGLPLSIGITENNLFVHLKNRGNHELHQYDKNDLKRGMLFHDNSLCGINYLSYENGKCVIHYNDGSTLNYGFNLR